VLVDDRDEKIADLQAKIRLLESTRRVLSMSLSEADLKMVDEAMKNIGARSRMSFMRDAIVEAAKRACI